MAAQDKTLVDEIPNSMQKLARYVVRGFYGVEHGVTLDLLIRNVCMREDELRELLRFDPKQLRSVLITLKSDKLIKERQEVEQRVEGRPVRHNYYFINYPALINVLKYKLDHMRRKLEAEEKSNIRRSSFKCTKCEKVYSDLEIDILWDSNQMKCVYCRGVVEEDETANEKQVTRSSLAKFNEQMWPLFQILQELEGVELAPHLLEPAPSRVSKSSQSEETGEKNAGGNFMGANFSMKKEVEMQPRQNFVINVEKADGHLTRNIQKQKELPVWMQASTVTNTGSSMLPVSEASAHAIPSFTIVDASVSPKHDIVETLLVNEMKPTSSLTVGAEVASDESDEFEEVEEQELKVTVQGRQVALSELTEDPSLISAMTPAEKQHYIKISQQAFESLYGD
ncbi:unnamed protein product [Soboliphyme baturini]|uniref:HTH TFE/IIEalpha-type domain-containing protein n=1 Tax=Soboliphyme baturini TaxID=241478 RepID=A0A183IIS2_9BILA|nr:unnamed protein product [Soboliphyme baturini]